MCVEDSASANLQQVVPRAGTGRLHPNGSGLFREQILIRYGVGIAFGDTFSQSVTRWAQTRCCRPKSFCFAFGDTFPQSVTRWRQARRCPATRTATTTTRISSRSLLTSPHHAVFHVPTFLRHKTCPRPPPKRPPKKQLGHLMLLFLTSVILSRGIRFPLHPIPLRSRVYAIG